MATTLPLLLSIFTTLLFTINANITPIDNSTGEYWIATTSNSAINTTITCNTTKAHCYIICRDHGVCENAHVQCASANCNIQCSSSSCKNIRINTSSSIQTEIFCQDDNACSSMQFTMESNGRESANMNCYGPNACSMSTIQTKQVTLHIDCAGSQSCKNQKIYTDKNSQLTLLCYKNSSSNHSSNCAGSTLLISGNNHYTQLSCNGGLNTGSCSNMQILIPQDYQYDALEISYMDDSGNNMTAMDGSADNLKINCIDVNNSIADCTEDIFIDTSYPILNIATPTTTNTYTNTAAYSYRYKAIMCNTESTNNSICEIKCIGTQSCNFMYINSSISNTLLFCNGTGECDNVMIEATGNRIDIECHANQACKTLSVLEGSTAIVNIDSTATSGCYDLNATTNNNIFLTCTEDNSCEYISLVSGMNGTTNLNCMETTSCKTIAINSSNGVDISCPASYACNTLDVNVFGGDLNAMCRYDHSCFGSKFNVTTTGVSTNKLECTGANACDQIILKTTAQNIILNCSGCAQSKIQTYNINSTLTINCEQVAACNSMNVTTDGIVNMNCTMDQSCVAAKISNRTQQNTNIYTNSIINCLGTDACNDLVFTTRTDILAKCVGVTPCAASHIQSLTGKIDMTCNNNKSCVESVINAYSDVNLQCMDSYACSQVNVTGNGQLYLDCSNNGNSNCAHMNIKMGDKRPGARQATNTLKCGNDNNPLNQSDDSTYSCEGLQLGTYAMDVNVQCVSSGGGGCLGADIVLNNDQSKLHMACQGNDSCTGLFLYSNGEIASMGCNGERSCAGANIISEAQTNGTTIYCEGTKACSGSGITTGTYANINCHGVTSCNHIAVIADAVTMQCNGDNACSHSNITGNGALSLDCSSGGVDACAEMFITMSADSDISNVNSELKCGINAAPNETQSFACFNTIFKSYATNVNIDCYGVGCSGTDVKLYNPKSKLNMNCNQFHTCYKTKINTVGALTLNCNGGKSCESISVISKTDIQNSLNCTGESACTLMSFTSTSDLSAICNGTSSCETVNVVALETSLKCIGNQACYDSNLTTSGDLILDCSGIGNENCGGMIIQNGQHNSNPKSTNTFICNNKDPSDSSGSSCANNIIDTYAKTINFDCSNMGGNACAGTWITAHNDDSELSMHCAGSTACWTTSVNTNGKISANCTGSGACQAAYIRQLKPDIETIINCAGDKACFSLELDTADNASVNCIGEQTCGELTIDSDTSINMICAGFSSCINSKISGNNNLILDCSGAIKNVTNTQTCSEMTINMALNINKTTNTFICGNDGINTNISVAYSCVGTTINTYADDINFKCYEHSCYNLNMNISNPTNKLDMLCQGSSSCSLMNVKTDGEMNIACHGSQSCKASNFNPITSQPRILGNLNSLYCTGESACISMRLASAADLYTICNGATACKTINLVALKTNLTCIGDQSCYDSNITTSGALKLDCNGVGNENCGGMIIQNHCKIDTSCYNLDFVLSEQYNYGVINVCENKNITMLNAHSVGVYCDSECKCKDLNIITTNVSYVNVTAVALDAKGKDNTFNGSYINATNVSVVDINCNGLCSDNTIDANYSTTSVNIVCDTTHTIDANVDDLVGCNAWTVNAADAKNVSLDFRGKYAAPNGVFDVSNAKIVNVRYESNVGYTTNDTNDRSLIMAPVKNNLQLQCYNYGCYFGNFHTKNGLSDINATFGGTCNCTKIEDCINDWELECDSGSNSFVGNKCSDGVTCCSKGNIQTIKKAFTNYTNDAKCPASGHSSNGLSGGAIAGIVIGILAFILAIAFGIWYYRKKKVGGPTMEEPLVNN